MHNAHSRMVKILEEITELKRQRAQFLEQLKGVINTHQKLLEVHDESEAAQVSEARVSVLRKPAPPALPETTTNTTFIPLKKQNVGA
jgi:hypothetical protein